MTVLPSTGFNVERTLGVFLGVFLRLTLMHPAVLFPSAAIAGIGAFNNGHNHNLAPSGAQVKGVCHG